jgi:aminoglycoside phosphotransferase (APT) family kinase protein
LDKASPTGDRRTRATGASIGAVAVEPVAVPEPLASWLRDALDDPGPFTTQALSGGNSNETLRLTGATGSWIVRRPPAAGIDATANDMRREHRVLSALHDRGVPAPRAVALCTDPAVWPHPLLVLELVPGVALSGAVPADWHRAADADTLREIGTATVSALAALHTVDWRAAGLEGFGRPEGYLERQVGRWRKQYRQHQVRELELFEPVAGWLERHRPADTPPALLHGDFHTDNALFVPGPPVRVSAVIDWELATIGDPLVDLGLLLAFWGADRPAPPAMPTVQALTRLPGAPGRQQLAEQYCLLTGRDIADLDWYMALAFFKLAAIVEGAYARLLAGDVDSRYARDLETDVPRLLTEAAGFAGLHV